MMDVPNEVLQLIFHNLSQRYLARCSLVCRGWYRTIQPLLFDAVVLGSQQQLDKFVKTIESNTSYGNMIRKILLLSDGFRSIDDTTFASLQRVCPNVSVVEFESYPFAYCYCLPPRALDKWKHLTVLSVEPQHEHSTWYDKAHQLTSLRVKKLTSLPTLTCLRDLHLDYPDIDTTLNNGFWKSLTNTCPSLTTLHLDYIALAEQHDETLISKITPINSIRSLRIGNSYIMNPSRLYQFCSLAFPSLASLDINVSINFVSSTDEEKSNHQAAVYRMITGFRQLTSLAFFVDQFDFDRETVNLALPTCGMMETWLCSQRIQSLDWSYSSIFKHSSRVDLQTRLYLNYLTNLEVQVDQQFTATDLLRFLLCEHTRSTIPSQLATLTVKGYRLAQYFDIHAWAKACPRLKNLTLYNLLITGSDSINSHNCSRNDGDGDNDNDNDKTRLFLRLEKLVLLENQVQLDGGLTELVKLCPSMKALQCDYDYIYTKNHKSNNNNNNNNTSNSHSHSHSNGSNSSDEHHGSNSNNQRPPALDIDDASTYTMVLDTDLDFDLLQLSSLTFGLGQSVALVTLVESNGGVNRQLTIDDTGDEENEGSIFVRCRSVDRFVFD